jgi:hypothetical protein
LRDKRVQAVVSRLVSRFVFLSLMGIAAAPRLRFH